MEIRRKGMEITNLDRKLVASLALSCFSMGLGLVEQSIAPYML